MDGDDFASSPEAYARQSGAGASKRTNASVYCTPPTIDAYWTLWALEGKSRTQWPFASARETGPFDCSIESLIQSRTKYPTKTVKLIIATALSKIRILDNVFTQWVQAAMF